MAEAWRNSGDSVAHFYYPRPRLGDASICGRATLDGAAQIESRDPVCDHCVEAAS